MARSDPALDRIGEYRLDTVIGRGASSTVWRGRRDGSLHQAVAVKVLSVEADEAARQRLRAEAEILASLDHPHVVRILDIVDPGDGSLGVVMQLAPGGSVADLVEQRGPLTAGQAVALAAPVASALGSAHRRGLVHGDVKPANVLLSSDGEPLLADFGMAHLVEAHAPGGTDAYLAPEVRDGAPAGHAADIWALGATCADVLAGPLAVTRSADELAAARPDLPAELLDVLARMLAVRPEDRPVDADQLSVALRGAVATEEIRRPDPLPLEALPGASARPPTRAFGAGPPRRAREGGVPWPQVARLGAVAVGLVVVAAVVVWPDGGEECPEPDTSQLASRGAQVLTADLDGSGCAQAVAFGEDPALDAMVLEVWDGEGRLQQRFRVGEPGDQLLLGDWDCDEAHTAALYRPGDGSVVVFDRWPSGESGLEPSSRRAATAGGSAAVVADPDGCDVVEVSNGVDA